MNRLQKWQHKVVNLVPLLGSHHIDSGQIQEVLTEAELDGWQLVAVGNFERKLFFKREYQFGEHPSLPSMARGQIYGPPPPPGESFNTGRWDCHYSKWFRHQAEA